MPPNLELKTMGTLILDEDEQNYDPKQIEKVIQDLRHQWRMKTWTIENGDLGETTRITLLALPKKQP